MTDRTKILEDTRNLKIPGHIAIIPDGNRRWAVKHNLPISMGHKKGVDVLKEVMETSYDIGVACLSFWGASLANLTRRTKTEIRLLDTLYGENFKKLLDDPNIHEKQVRVRVFGEWETVLSEKAKRAIREAAAATGRYDRLLLNFFIAYDGRVEMVQAIAKIVRQAQLNPEIKITRELIKQNLYTHDIPPVDLLIRTGGEPHLSAGFMMWEMTEAQLYFTDKFWPDFTGNDLKEAVTDYHNRDRRFGK